MWSIGSHLSKGGNMLDLVKAMEEVEQDQHEKCFIIELVLPILIATKVGIKKQRIVSILRVLADSCERQLK